MFERILVPLDGSELAEITLPYVEELGGKLDSEVVLVHACLPEHKEFTHMHQIYINQMAEQVRMRIKQKFPAGKATVRAQLLTAANIGEGLCTFVKEQNMELVVIATHGASGFSKVMIGSVADRVCRMSPSPTLLIRAGIKPAAGQLFNHILAPLDGSEASEKALETAIDMALKLKVKITLFRMVRSGYAYAGMEGMVPGMSMDFSKLDAAEEQRIRVYLADMAEKVKARGVAVSFEAKLGFDPAQDLIETGQKVKADLVVMSTRGNSPLARWVFGSTAEKVLRDGDLPLLLSRQVKVETRKAS